MPCAPGSNSDEGISYTEFSYQILQGMDFLELYRSYGCVLQTGGSDQWGNLTSGIDLIHKAEGVSAHAIGTPLITNSRRHQVRQERGQRHLARPRDHAARTRSTSSGSTPTTPTSSSDSRSSRSSPAPRSRSLPTRSSENRTGAARNAPGAVGDAPRARRGGGRGGRGGVRRPLRAGRPVPAGWHDARGRAAGASEHDSAALHADRAAARGHRALPEPCGGPQSDRGGRGIPGQPRVDRRSRNPRFCGSQRRHGCAAARAGKRSPASSSNSPGERRRDTPEMRRDLHGTRGHA